MQRTTAETLTCCHWIQEFQYSPAVDVFLPWDSIHCSRYYCRQFLLISSLLFPFLAKLMKFMEICSNITSFPIDFGVKIFVLVALLFCQYCLFSSKQAFVFYKVIRTSCLNSSIRCKTTFNLALSISGLDMTVYNSLNTFVIIAFAVLFAFFNSRIPAVAILN